MKKYILVTLMFLLASCEALSGLSLTTEDQLVPEAIGNPEVVPFPPEYLPKELTESPNYSGKTFVLAPDEFIKEGAPKVSADPSEDETGAWMTDGLALVAGLAKSWLPGMAALEALFLTISRRKRQHYANAVRAIAPTNGSIDVKESMANILRAFGVLHTSTATEALAEKQVASAQLKKKK